jgi:hypothetical protein
MQCLTSKTSNTQYKIIQVALFLICYTQEAKKKLKNGVIKLETFKKIQVHSEL